MFAINKENLKTLKYHIFLKDHQVFSLFALSVIMNIKKYFKKKNQFEIVKILSLITNIEKYQKIYNHD